MMEVMWFMLETKIVSHNDDAHVTIYEGSKLNLKDVLVVSKLKKNFLSIEKFTSNNSCTSKFTLSSFIVMDWNQKATSMGIRKDSITLCFRQNFSTNSY